jgi:hypothetical protein
LGNKYYDVDFDIIMAHACLSLLSMLISKPSNYHKYFLEHNIKHYNSGSAAGGQSAVGDVKLLAFVSMKVLKCVLLLNE